MGGGPEPASTLGSKVLSSFRWSLASTVVSRLATVLTGIALARILAPADFGAYAVALVGLTTILSLNDIGLAATIVRWPGDVDRIGATATTVVLGASAALYGVLFLVAPFAADALHAPESTGVLRLLGLAVLVDGVAAVPTVVLTRSFLQDRRAVADLAGLVTGTAVTIVLALLGEGAWSLAWGRLVGNATVAAVVVALSPSRYRPGLSLPLARELLGFGLPLAAASMITVAIVNVDYIVVGRVLGPVALGFYVLAFNLASWPASLALVTIRRVSLAGFAALQHDHAALEAAFARGFALLVAVAFPISVLLAALAGPLVGLLYGSRWEPSTAPLRLLALAGGLRVAVELMEDLLVAVGRPRTVFWIYCAWFATLILALAVGAEAGGLSGAAWGRLVVTAAVVTPAFLWATRRAGIRAGEVLPLLRRPLVATALCAAVAAVLVEVVTSSNLARLVVAGAAATGVYALTVYPMRRLLSVSSTSPASPSSSR
ncbi:MAG TPA: lipopolysaccharide biosynthesis protein [Candidatus Dormibacteraeota bacterium]|nr:lipopolysaccharide biosynthesis protein [Candidatus Dormibacteraeota bacterium]